MLKRSKNNMKNWLHNCLPKVAKIALGPVWVNMFMSCFELALYYSDVALYVSITPIDMILHPPLK
jgi:hypothetical protein